MIVAATSDALLLTLKVMEVILGAQPAAKRFKTRSVCEQRGQTHLLKVFGLVRLRELLSLRQGRSPPRAQDMRIPGRFGSRVFKRRAGELFKQHILRRL